MYLWLSLRSLGKRWSSASLPATRAVSAKISERWEGTILSSSACMIRMGTLMFLMYSSVLNSVSAALMLSAIS